MNDDVLEAIDLEYIRDNPYVLGHLAGFTKLTPLHSEWIKYIWNPQQEKRALQAHRYSYKTTAIIVIGVIYWLLFHPNATIGIVRKTVTDAQECLRNISTLMQKDEFKAIFLKAHGITPRLEEDNANTLRFNFKETVTREGSVNAYGIKTGATGKHVDAAICDDFVTIDDKISVAERKRTAAMMEELIINVLNPAGLIGFIGTPWHRNDCWSLKAIPEPKQWDVNSTDILTEVEKADKRKNTTAITWAANYLLKHVSSEDALFKNPHYAKWQYQHKKAIGHIDKAYSGNDTTAVTFCEKKPDGRYQVIGLVFTANIKDKWDFILQKYKQFYVGTVHTENNDDKGFATDELRKKGILASDYHEHMNKHVKIQTYLLENGFFDLIDFDIELSDPEYITQVLDYVENSTPDDAPDSLACIGRILIGKDADYIERWKKK